MTSPSICSDKWFSTLFSLISLPRDLWLVFSFQSINWCYFLERSILQTGRIYSKCCKHSFDNVVCRWNILPSYFSSSIFYILYCGHILFPFPTSPRFPLNFIIFLWKKKTKTTHKTRHPPPERQKKKTLRHSRESHFLCSY